MVVRKGTACVINYVVYECPPVDGGNVDWEEVREEGVDVTGLVEVDRRTMFRFRFGLGELQPELEALIAENPTVLARRGNSLVHIERQETEGKLHMSLDETFAELVALKGLGNELLKERRIEEAVTTYDEAIEIMTSPDFNRRTERDVKEVFSPLFLNKALCCLKLSRFGDCIECCSKVLEADPNNVKALFRRGVARIENKELGAGKRDLLCALDLEPKNSDVLQQLERLKRVDVEEKQLYNRMVNSGPSSASSSCEAKVCMTVAVAGKEWKLQIVLKEKEGPKTVENFKRLLPKYSECAIFKLVKDQLFQTGDYCFNDGSGGDCAVDPDSSIRNRRFFKDESLSGLHDRPGVVGMSNYGPNSNGSQFYVTLAPCPHLDGKHVVFGQVVEGLDALKEINAIASSDILESIPTVALVVKSIELVCE